MIEGVIGTGKFSYDLWGDTVNTASRMRTQGVGGSIDAGQDAIQRGLRFHAGMRHNLRYRTSMRIDRQAILFHVAAAIHRIYASKNEDTTQNLQCGESLA